jgi:capsular polysaccharide biosynthesis protein
VNDPDQIAWDTERSESLGERLAAYEDPADLDDRAAGPASGLVNLGFLWAALGRRTRLWATLAVLGLIIGAGYYVASPPVYKATTSLLLAAEPTTNALDAAQTDIALAQSLPVATAVVRELGLPQTPESFSGSYTVTPTSTQILTITATGATSDKAVQIARAIAQNFLSFRATYQQTQYNLLKTQLDQQLAAAQQQVNAASTNAQKTAAANNLGAVQSYATPALAAAKTSMQQLIEGSVVLNAAEPLKVSKVKGIAKYAASGLAIGLALGVGIIVIAAITSDKLRRRDDIAYAIGAPVRLSVGRLRGGRTSGLYRRSAGIRQGNMDHLVDHLRQVLPGEGGAPARLAVVPVDDTATAAEAVVALAVSVATNKRVVVADLSAGAPAARLLGVKDPGVAKVTHGGSVMMVVMPSARDVSPIGPLLVPDGNADSDPALVSAFAKADVVLSLVSLDPVRGGDHLTTWATDVVALVTTGRSTATRIHTVGEMIRMAGARLASVVVMGVDKSDESLGATTEYLTTAEVWA